MSRNKKFAHGKIRISVGEGCLIRDKIHMVKMGEASDNPTHWQIYRADFVCPEPWTAAEMTLFVMGYCGASVQCEGPDKTHALLEVDLGYDSEINIAGQKSTKRNVFHPAHPIKRSDMYSSQMEYTFVIVRLDQKSVNTNPLGGLSNSPEGLLAFAIRQLKAGCLQDLKCHKPLPRQFSDSKFQREPPNKRVFVSIESLTLLERIC
jgi:hypothetical protein